MKQYSSSAGDFATEPQYTDSIAIKPYQESSADPTSMMTIIRDQQIIAETRKDERVHGHNDEA